jgi:hypothetical protein
MQPETGAWAADHAMNIASVGDAAGELVASIPP